MRFTGIKSFISLVKIFIGCGYKPHSFSYNDITKLFKEHCITISKLECDIILIEDTISINFYNVYGVSVIDFVLKR